MSKDIENKRVKNWTIKDWEAYLIRCMLWFIGWTVFIFGGIYLGIWAWQQFH